MFRERFSQERMTDVPILELHRGSSRRRKKRTSSNVKEITLYA